MLHICLLVLSYLRFLGKGLIGIVWRAEALQGEKFKMSSQQGGFILPELSLDQGLLNIIWKDSLAHLKTKGTAAAGSVGCIEPVWLVACVGPNYSYLWRKKIVHSAISSLGLSVVCKRQTGELPLLVAEGPFEIRKGNWK